MSILWLYRLSERKMLNKRIPSPLGWVTWHLYNAKMFNSFWPYIFLYTTVCKWECNSSHRYFVPSYITLYCKALLCAENFNSRLLLMPLSRYYFNSWLTLSPANLWVSVISIRALRLQGSQLEEGVFSYDWQKQKHHFLLRQTQCQLKSTGEA